MSVAIRTITRLQDADDVNVTLGAGVDEYVLAWDNDTARFVLRTPFAGLLATGATTGATSQAQTFTNGIVGPSWKPSANSTTALQLQNASGTSVLNVDTTNGRVGIGTTSPATELDVRATGSMYSGIITVHSQYGTSWLSLLSGALGYTGVPPSIVYPLGSKLNIVAGSLNYEYLALGVVIENDWLGIFGSPSAPLHARRQAAAHNSRVTCLQIANNPNQPTGSGAAAEIRIDVETTTTKDIQAASIFASWYDATHATRKADLVLTAYDTAEREGLRIRGNGSAAAIGFLGAAPAARIAHVADPSGGATVDAEARSAINSILATLEGFGFHATS